MFGVRSRASVGTGLVLAVVVATGQPVRADTVVKVPNDAGTFDASVVTGDFNGDGRTDLALTGATTWRNVPVAFSTSDGSFDMKYSPAEETDEDIARFSWWAAAAGAQILTGDFDGDGRTDLALTGASTWRNVPVAFSNGDGTFKVTNAESSDFASWASEPGVTVTTGDFNKDGRTDVALTPGPKSEWTGLPVALSNGDGTFEVRNEKLTDFAGRAREPGARVTAGDFNRDGSTDLALTGGAKWTALPVALSNGDGTFAAKSQPLTDFASRAQEPGARVTTGDFNRDGSTDLALTGGAKWETMPVALSKGDGTFEARSERLAGFAGWAQEPGARVTAGDFNHDGSTDLALTGGAKWETMPVALSKGDGSFDVRSEPLADFANRAQQPGAKLISGDFDGNGTTDMLLAGVADWTIVPVAWSNGDAHFTVTGVLADKLLKYLAPLGPAIDFPGLGPGGHPTGLQPSAKTVTVKWYDRSDNERGFQVDKRDQNGNWQMVRRISTLNVPGTGQQYSWVDTSQSISGQCYRVGAYNDTYVAYTTEICTVRPDPDVFPQYAGTAALQWYGLTSTNDGTGNLINANVNSHLAHGDNTGVDLDWADDSLWRVQAQGGPHLMKGQAVALRVWGGGWLKYGSQTWGVDLQLSDTPAYEWYVIGDSHDPYAPVRAGDPLVGGDFALWNSAVKKYLVKGDETFGIQLKWYAVTDGSQTTPPPPPPTAIKTYQVFNCTSEYHTLHMWVRDSTAGTPYNHVGSVEPNWTNYGSCGSITYSGSPFTYTIPTTGHTYELVAVDSNTNYCSVGEPNPNVAFNCVRMDSGQFLGGTTGVPAIATVN
jgi:FG-GAP-like repeat